MSFTPFHVSSSVHFEMEAPLFCINTGTDVPRAIHLLVYMGMKLKREAQGAMDFVDNRRLTSVDNIPFKDSKVAFALGSGEHKVYYGDCELVVDVKAFFSEVQSVVLVKTYPNSTVAKQVTIRGMKSREHMETLLKDASAFVASEFLQDGVVQYMFQPKNRILAAMGYMKSRPRQSMFLKQGQADKLFNAVKDFIDSKDVYSRCFVPYKMNIFMYGLPGSGKTSLITAVASEFNLGLVVIPFSENLTDETLVYGITKAHEIGCRIVVLEDVDCLFDQNRKPHDHDRTGLTLSGLLNCMDGILRGGAGGMMMFLTANFTTQIDAAVLRSARVDLAIPFTHADEFQAKACYEFYASVFGWKTDEDEWARFWKGVGCMQFSVATLQQHFFKQGALCVEDFKEAVRHSGKGGVLEDTAGLFYT